MQYLILLSALMSLAAVVLAQEFDVDGSVEAFDGPAYDELASSAIALDEFEEAY